MEENVIIKHTSEQWLKATKETGLPIDECVKLRMVNLKREIYDHNYNYALLSKKKYYKNGNIIPDNILEHSISDMKHPICCTNMSIPDLTPLQIKLNRFDKYKSGGIFIPDITRYGVYQNPFDKLSLGQIMTGDYTLDKRDLKSIIELTREMLDLEYNNKLNKADELNDYILKNKPYKQQKLFRLRRRIYRWFVKQLI